MNFDKELDARGLNCPLPILRAKKALNDMQSGQVLKIVATDPGSVKDFETFAKQTSSSLSSSSASSGLRPAARRRCRSPCRWRPPAA